jgi:hypothetical protein
MLPFDEYPSEYYSTYYPTRVSELEEKDTLLLAQTVRIGTKVLTVVVIVGVISIPIIWYIRRSMSIRPKSILFIVRAGSTTIEKIAKAKNSRTITLEDLEKIPETVKRTIGTKYDYRPFQTKKIIRNVPELVDMYKLQRHLDILEKTRRLMPVPVLPIRSKEIGEIVIQNPIKVESFISAEKVGIIVARFRAGNLSVELARKAVQKFWKKNPKAEAPSKNTVSSKIFAISTLLPGGPVKFTVVIIGGIIFYRERKVVLVKLDELKKIVFKIDETPTEKIRTLKTYVWNNADLVQVIIFILLTYRIISQLGKLDVPLLSPFIRLILGTSTVAKASSPAQSMENVTVATTKTFGDLFKGMQSNVRETFKTYTNSVKDHLNHDRAITETLLKKVDKQEALINQLMARRTEVQLKNQLCVQHFETMKTQAQSQNLAVYDLLNKGYPVATLEGKYVDLTDLSQVFLKIGEETSELGLAFDGPLQKIATQIGLGLKEWIKISIADSKMYGVNSFHI